MVKKIIFSLLIGIMYNCEPVNNISNNRDYGIIISNNGTPEHEVETFLRYAYKYYSSRDEFETKEEYNERMSSKNISNLMNACTLIRILPWNSENRLGNPATIIGLEHISHLYDWLNICHDIYNQGITTRDILYREGGEYNYIGIGPYYKYDIDKKILIIDIISSYGTNYDQTYFTTNIDRDRAKDIIDRITSEKRGIELEYSMEDMVQTTRGLLVPKKIDLFVDGTKVEFKVNAKTEKINYNFIKKIAPTYKESSILELPIIIRYPKS